jgi:hypothetical protein
VGVIFDFAHLPIAYAELRLPQEAAKNRPGPDSAYRTIYVYRQETFQPGENTAFRKFPKSFMHSISSNMRSAHRMSTARLCTEGVHAYTTLTICHGAFIGVRDLGSVSAQLIIQLLSRPYATSNALLKATPY